MLLLPKEQTVEAGEPSRKAILFRKSESVRQKVLPHSRAQSRPVTAEARSGAAHLRTGVHKVALEQVFVQVLWFFPCQYLSITASRHVAASRKTNGRCLRTVQKAKPTRKPLGAG
jgi:hypothetical protein